MAGTARSAAAAAAAAATSAGVRSVGGGSDTMGIADADRALGVVAVAILACDGLVGIFDGAQGFKALTTIRTGIFVNRHTSSSMLLV